MRRFVSPATSPGSSLSRRELVKRAALAGAAVPTAGLLGGRPAPLAAAPARQEISGDIEFWSRETFDNGARQPRIEERLAAFDAEYGTTSSVQFMVFQESIQKTQAAIAAGDPPDLGQQGPDVSLQFAAGGYLRNLDDIFAPMQEDFLPLQKEAFVTYEGSTYALPWYIETRVLFYHQDLLDEAGVTPPTTWAEWSEAAQALTRGDEQYGFVMLTEGPGAGQLWVPLASSAGGNLLSADGEIQADSDPFRESLQFIADLYEARVMPEATPTYTNNDVLQLFLLKRAAMIWYNGAIMQSIVTQAPDLAGTVGAVLTPVAEEGAVSRSFLGGFQLFVFNDGDNPDGATELMKYLFEPEWYAEYLAATNGAALPATRAAADQPLYQDDPILSTLIEQEATAIRYGGPDYGNAPYLGEAEGALLFSQPVIDVMTGTRTVDEAVTFLDTELKALAEQG
jgi:ABC-type glycerol-3-phosphate transport system substrate-binding protein